MIWFGGFGLKVPNCFLFRERDPRFMWKLKCFHMNNHALAFARGKDVDHARVDITTHGLL